MCTSGRLRPRDIRAAYQLLDEVIELGQDPHAWRQHALVRLGRLTGARVGLSLELTNFFPGAPPVPIDPIDVGFDGPCERMQYQLYLQSDQRAVDPSTERLIEVARDRQFLTLCRQQFVQDAHWYGSPFVSEARRASNVDSFVCSLYRLPTPGSTTGFIFYKNWGEGGFDERCRRLLRLFHLQLVRRILRDAALEKSNGADLPPHLSRLLNCLLRGDSVKLAADSLQISVTTAKTYSKSLYSRLQVQSRGQLLAKLLGAPMRRTVRLPDELPV